MRVRFAAEWYPGVFVLYNIDRYTRDLVVFGQEVSGQPKAKGLDLFDLICLSGEGIDGIFHRVRRQTFAVVTLDVDVIEIALERYLDVNVLKFMPVAATRDFHQAHPRFSIIVVNQLY